MSLIVSHSSVSHSSVGGFRLAEALHRLTGLGYFSPEARAARARSASIAATSTASRARRPASDDGRATSPPHRSRRRTPSRGGFFLWRASLLATYGE
jgi:hypothetical protein